MNKKTGKASDKTIINLLIVANFFSLTVNILEKLHEKNVIKLDINININCKYVHIKKYEEKEMKNNNEKMCA